MTSPRLALFAISAVAAAALLGCRQSPPSPATGGAGAPAPAGDRLTIAMMPKQKSIDYFNACERGAREAADELGDIEFLYNGPDSDRSEDQSRMLDTWIVRGVDVICIACNDKDQIAPALKRARDAGIHVITYDSDANAETSGREYFVNQASVEGIARSLVDEMARQVGGSGQVAILSSTPTAPNQNAWIAAMKPYLAEQHAGLELLPIHYGAESRERSHEEAQKILKAYPQVQGIWGITSVAFPAAAEAVREAGAAGKVRVVGLSTPKAMAPLVEAGVVETVILWNAVELGYLTIRVARAVARGDLSPGATTFEAGRLGSVQVTDDEVLLGEPMIFDRTNIAGFDF